MKRFNIAISLVFLLTFFMRPAEGGDILKVEEMVFCKNIENMSPVGVKNQFFESVEKLYCFTKIAGALDTTSVYHIWYYDGGELARVKLPVRSPLWRTWSSKRMIDSWEGSWKVVVTTQDSTVISEKEFIYKPLKE
ncbi:MAG: DUF2914 domain-containing protein [Candidatus Krumholzibacteriota bacterium]|nr:DUF2914 domain-containing protein [Candidatus Krumholzibacteriota bacterium]